MASINKALGLVIVLASAGLSAQAAPAVDTMPPNNQESFRTSVEGMGQSQADAMLLQLDGCVDWRAPRTYELRASDLAATLPRAAMGYPANVASYRLNRIVPRPGQHDDCEIL